MAPSILSSMKILLLNPPTFDNRKFIREGRCTQEQGAWTTLWPPISLATIGAVLEREGNEVKIIDCPAEGINLEKLQSILKSFLPHMVIWSGATPSIHSDLMLATFIKRIDSSVSTAIFGTHVTALAQRCMEATPSLDFIIRNEPEETILWLVRNHDRRKYEDIEGLTYRARDGNIVHNPPRPFIENLDALPWPAWHLLDLNCYRLPLRGNKFLMISPFRGCSYGCIFCTSHTYYGKKLRSRSTEGILEEIEYDVEKFGIKDFFFWADTFTLNKKYVEEICLGIIRRRLRISWACNSRTDTVEASLLKLMADAGCWMISYGIESGSQKILDMAKKAVKAEKAVEAVQEAKRVGMKVVGHFILGLPGEDRQTVEETLHLVNRLDLDFAQFYCATPFPGSEL